MKKIFFMPWIILFFWVGCQTQKSQIPLAQKDTIQVGIVSIVDHPSLDSARFGAMAEMEQYANANKKHVYFEYYSANFSKDKEVSILNDFIGKKKDLIITIATSPTQSAKGLTQKIPIVFAAVTNPIGDSIVQTAERPGANISGASDLYPVKEQLQLIKKSFPNAKKIGFIYNKGETNSVYLARIAKKYADSLGLEFIPTTAERTNDVSIAVATIIKKVDVFIMPTDNTAAAAVNIIGEICAENNVPFVSTETGSVINGLSVFSTYRNYSIVGKETGKIAVRVLQGEDISRIPVSFLNDYELVINKKLLKKYHAVVDPNWGKSAKITEY